MPQEPALHSDLLRGPRVELGLQHAAGFVPDMESRS